MKTAIIGIGSPFGGDQAGWEAVDALAETAWVQARLAAGTLVLHKLDRPGMELLEHLRGYAQVILVDAVIAPHHAPGTLIKLQREELALLETPASSHGFGVAETLAMGEALGLLPETLEIWGVVVATVQLQPIGHKNGHECQNSQQVHGHFRADVFAACINQKCPKLAYWLITAIIG